MLLSIYSWSIFRLPLDMWFDGFAFHDAGANLAVAKLIDDGFRPSIDFGYQYGLLSLSLGRLWFQFTGNSPVAYCVGCALLNLGITFGMAKFAVAMNLSRWATALLIVSLPIGLQPVLPSFAHGFERLFLVLAMAAHARGNRPWALALLVLACFSKPGIAYVYGFLLVVSLLWESWRKEEALRSLAEGFIPALAMGCSLLTWMLLEFGFDPVRNTLFPFVGAEHYRQMNYGFFFGSGRVFWAPANPRIGYFISTPFAYWVTASLSLIAMGGRSLMDLRSKSLTATRLRSEVVASLAILHVIFVTLMYGGDGHWVSYAVLLVMGACTLRCENRMQTATAALLILLAISGLRAEVIFGAKNWRSATPRSEVAGLWIPQREWEELQEVLKLVQSQQSWQDRDSSADIEIVELCYSSAGSVLHTQGFNLARPVGLWYMPGITLPEELSRKDAQLAQASAVLVYKPAKNVLGYFPEFRQRLNEFRVTHDGDSFQLFQRNR